MKEQVIPKAQLLVIMERFLKDPKRGISIKLFAELCGIHLSHLRDVFVYHNEPLTEWVQRRVTRAYMRWSNGEVAVMQNRDKTRFLQMRPKPKPRVTKTLRLKIGDSGFKVVAGLKNKADYSYQTIDEMLGGK